MSSNSETPVFAIQVKAISALENPRTIEKLEVERRYWLEKEVPWFLVTENQIPEVVFSNIEWLYSLQVEELESSVDEEFQQFDQYSTWLRQYPNLKIIDLCKQLDTSYSLELGESLFQIRGMLAKRYFHFDITIPFTKLRCCDLVSESMDSIVEALNVSS